MRFFAILGAISTLFTSAFAPIYCQESDPEWVKTQMVRALGSFAQTIEAAYAPTEWKRQLWGWDLEEQISIVSKRIFQEPVPTIQEFRSLLRDFFASARDHHLAIFFYSTERSDLPFCIRKASGTYCFASINRNYLPRKKFPVALGDEILSFNHEPIDAALSKLRDLLGLLPDQTGESLAEKFLTARQGALGHPLLSGDAIISIRRRADGKILSFKIPWIYTSEQISSQGVKSTLVSKHLSSLQDFLMEKPEGLAFEKNMWEIGSRYTYTPDLGNILWKTDDTWGFHAYLFESGNGKRYGYIRIPNFSFSVARLNEIESLIAFFEKESEGLVIDIANNPGGYLLTAYAVLALLTEKPLIPPRHAIKLYPKEINRAVKGLSSLAEAKNLDQLQAIMGKTNDGYPITMQFGDQLKKYFAFIIDQWSRGKLLTEPCAYLGIDCIQPHPTVQFKKPILLLTNALCFSGSDFFSAILKDNRRATLMGETTAGAGGVMLEVGYPNLFGVQSFHLTTTLAERNNNQYIENVGVMPDIFYRLTQEDLKSHHSLYAAEIIRQIEFLSE